MMNERRPQPTTADYLLAGLSPALIIGMINCLVFFLIIVIYRGDFTVRLMYLLGLYTLGSVMVARIAIEQNRAVAFGYMLGLGAAGLFVIQRFVAFEGVLAAFSIPIVLGFLVLIAFLADRITFDCTLIDEQEDSSGEGLLQSLRLVESTMTAEDRAKMAQRTQNGRKVKHNPGVWVLYFALLAIPLFGLGQLVIPSYDPGSRDRAFWFLVGYLFFALALLVNTSFLGLRRYLRKRSVAMPATMATTWMASGIIGVVLLLAVACFLPLPGRNAGLISLPFTATSPTNLQANSYGWGGEGVSQQPDQDRSKNEGAAKVENGKASEDKSKSVRSGDQPETSSDQSKSKSKDTSSNKDESSSRNDSSKSKDSNSKNDPSQKQTTPTESKSSDKSQPDAKSSQNQKSPTDQADKRQAESSAKDRMKSNNQGQKESQDSAKEQAGSKKDPEQKNQDPKTNSGPIKSHRRRIKKTDSKKTNSKRATGARATGKRFPAKDGATIAAPKRSTVKSEVAVEFYEFSSSSSIILDAASSAVVGFPARAHQVADCFTAIGSHCRLFDHARSGVVSRFAIHVWWFIAKFLGCGSKDNEPASGETPGCLLCL